MKSIARLGTAVVAVAALLLPGCAGLPSGMEAPAVTISDIGIGGASTLFEQQFSLKLRVQNPNDQELKIDGIAFSLEINDRLFASGVGNQAVTVPRFAAAVVPVEAYSSLGGVMRQLGGFLRGDLRAAGYRIKGTLSLAGGLRVPFERSGEFDPGALLPR